MPTDFENDDIVGHLFNECMVKLARRETPTADEIEAANIELEIIGLKLCLNKTPKKASSTI